ncbi:hypothetical protein [Iningainema tapete]|uniref:Uncharacterized protein n=1 Tax=Iningainema tapete BLCC-T55 TaxID=2748662 RepID=A0A8J7C5V0_9CYAN|nr:hypothetical protein [Iningainema tapete]MBD2771211.1 hypothetical protein [Iningainema tapete BLCC-T55]
MPASKKPEVQGRTAQLGIKIDADLYDKYKAKLKEDGISITDAIENHMRDYVGEMVITSNVIDIAKLLEDVERLKKDMSLVEDLKQVVGELQPDWQQRISSLKAS